MRNCIQSVPCFIHAGIHCVVKNVVLFSYNYGQHGDKKESGFQVYPIQQPFVEATSHHIIFSEVTGASM